jgi:hypothetical protein
MTTSYEVENGHPEHHISETDPDDSDASEVNMIISIEPHLVVPIYNTRRPVLGMGLEWSLSTQDWSARKRRRIQILARATGESEKTVLILKPLCRVSPLASVESFIVLY